MNADERARFRRRLLTWYDRGHRELPWRTEPTPYRVWVSEIMLQQTQVETVLDYFSRFMERFPDVRRLAAAPESAVLKAWEGLGYYRRARQLHRAAQIVVERHGGAVPDSFEEVLALPGIGRYTAGAILSIAFDKPMPIVEGNTIRLYSRLLDWDEPVSTKRSIDRMWEFAESLITRHRPGDLNQALMELGNQVCRKGTPECTHCPVASLCQARLAGTQARRPVKTAKTRIEAVDHVAVIVRRGNRILLRRCGPDEHWHGLWDFPRFVVPSDVNVDSATGQRWVATQLRETTGIASTLRPADIAPIAHAVTRYRITLHPFVAMNPRGRKRNGTPSELEWLPIDLLGQQPMNATGRQIANWLQAPHDEERSGA